MKILGMILSTLGSFGFIFYVILWTAEEYYTDVGPIWPMFFWVGAMITGIMIMARPGKKQFP
jgi:hypothetical protein